MDKKRIALFVDGGNFYHTQKKLGWDVDAERLLEFCKEFGEVVEATYYTGASYDPKQRRFHDWLAYNGYTLVTKPIKTIYDQTSGNTFQKANLDVDIVLDMFNRIDQYDVAILVSGDGDFERALQLLKSRNKVVKVISTRGCVASELVYVTGTNYIDFMTIREAVERITDEEVAA